MNTEIIALQDKDLELVVTEKTLGALTTNARQIYDLVKQSLPMYDVSNYTDENIEQAKTDKATLNKAAKSLNQKRIDIEKEFTKPFAEFKQVVGDTVKLISECSAKIDEVVKQNDQIYKDQKKAVILGYYNEKNTHGIEFTRLFKPEWLNKTAREKAVLADIDALLLQIDTDIKVLDGMPEDAAVLKTFYLDSLNISNTIQYANKLREQREKAALAIEEKKRIEEASKVVEPKNQGGYIFPEPDEHPSVSAEISIAQPSIETPNNIAPEMLTRAFKVTGTREDIIALGDYMNARGIMFEKIEYAG